MLNFSSARLPILVGSFLLTHCSFSAAHQATESLPPAATLNEMALEARVAEIRQVIVHSYGTAAEIASFDHPHQKGPKVVLPKPTTDGSINADMIAEIDSYTASRHDPIAIFDAIVIRRIMKETYPDGFNHPSGTAIKLMKDARYAAFFQSQLSGTLAQHTLTQANAAAQVADQLYREEQLAAGRAAEVERIMSTVLTSAEMEQYRAGDYRVRARLFFGAGLTILKRRQIPNAFVVMLCDPADWRQLGGLKEFGRADIYLLYPDEPRELLTEVKRWVSLTNLQVRLMRDGGDAFRTEQASESFLSKFHGPGSDPYDLSTPFAYATMLSTLGPSGKQWYLGASSDQQEMMKKTANAMYMATDVLIGTYVGQQ